MIDLRCWMWMPILQTRYVRIEVLVVDVTLEGEDAKGESGHVVHDEDFDWTQHMNTTS